MNCPMYYGLITPHPEHEWMICPMYCVLIPIESGFPTLRTNQFNVKENNRLLSASLNLVKERREMAEVKMAHYQQRLKNGYDNKVKLRPLASRDLILKKVVGIAKKPTWGKLSPNWESLYIITSVAGIGAYYLEDLDANLIPHP